MLLGFDMFFDWTFLLRDNFAASIAPQFPVNHSKMMFWVLCDPIPGTCPDSSFTVKGLNPGVISKVG